jgi:hypothetical protein
MVCFNKILMNFSLGKRRRRQQKTTKWSNLNFIKTALCGHILKKSHIHFLVMVIPLVIIRFAPNEGPKGFVN